MYITNNLFVHNCTTIKTTNKQKYKIVNQVIWIHDVLYFHEEILDTFLVAEIR